MVISMIKWLNVVVYLVIVLVAVIAKEFIWVWSCMEISIVVALVMMFLWGIKMGSIMEYYVYQTSSSLMMLMGWLGGMDLVVEVSLLIKLGLFPFQTYMLKVAGELVGLMYLVVLLFQKVIPLYLIYFIFGESALEGGVVISSVMVSVMVGVLGGLSFASFSGLMAYSSLIHSSWLTLIILMDTKLFIYYVLMYLSVMLVVSAYYGSVHKVSMGWMVMLMVSGFPPLVGFFLKMNMLYSGVIMYPSLFLVIMLMSSVSFLFYVRLLVLYLMGGSSVQYDTYAVGFVVVLMVVVISVLGMMVM
nr:NADH dehydrogenase subunit 2 [Moniliformis sp. XH-2020]